MRIPAQARPIQRTSSAVFSSSGVELQDNLCTCQKSKKMCPENKNCHCIDGWAQCLDE
jgi:hypothetical protein